MSTVFTPLTKNISWTDSTLAADGTALPPGEALSSTTLGIRTDGDATHALGNYDKLVIVPAASSTETLAALNAGLAKALAPGNYWLNASQTDTLNGVSMTSDWMKTEVPFSIPPQAVAPASPSALSVS